MGLSECQIGNVVEPTDLVGGFWDEIFKTLIILDWKEEVILIDNIRDEWFTNEILFPFLIKNEMKMIHGEIFEWGGIIGILIIENPFKGIVVTPEDRDKLIAKIMNFEEIYSEDIVSKELKEDHYTGKEEIGDSNS